MLASTSQTSHDQLIITVAIAPFIDDDTWYS